MRMLWIALFSFHYKKQINDILSCAAIQARQGDLLHFRQQVERSNSIFRRKSRHQSRQFFRAIVSKKPVRSSPWDSCSIVVFNIQTKSAVIWKSCPYHPQREIDIRMLLYKAHVHITVELEPHTRPSVVGEYVENAVSGPAISPPILFSIMGIIAAPWRNFTVFIQL